MAIKLSEELEDLDVTEELMRSANTSLRPRSNSFDDVLNRAYELSHIEKQPLKERLAKHVPPTVKSNKSRTYALARHQGKYEDIEMVSLTDTGAPVVQRPSQVAASTTLEDVDLSDKKSATPGLWNRLVTAVGATIASTGRMQASKIKGAILPR